MQYNELYMSTDELSPLVCANRMCKALAIRGNPVETRPGGA